MFTKFWILHYKNCIKVSTKNQNNNNSLKNKTKMMMILSTLILNNAKDNLHKMTLMMTMLMTKKRSDFFKIFDFLLLY